MRRMRIVSIIVVCAAAFAALVTGSLHWTGASASAPPRYLPIPGGEKGEQFALMDAYWNDRLTYPTGRFNPAWLRRAARQNARMESRVPSTAGPRGSSWTALGPQPERMDGCSGCYNYHKTEGRINDIVADPTTTTNGSIVAYSATVGGGVWKTTNCCSTSTTWTVLTDDPLISAIAIDTLDIDPNDHNTIYAGTGDLNYGSFSMGSQGILKSTDAGATWTVLGEEVFGPAYDEPPGQFPQYDAVGKVRVDPNNSSKVVAGTKKGIFVSYNGGVDWTGPCTTNGFTTHAPGHHRPRALRHGRRGHANHRRGRRARLCDHRAVRPRDERRKRALPRERARQRLPDVHVDRIEREWVRVRERGLRQPVHDRREHECGQRRRLCQSNDGRPARQDRHRSGAEQPERTSMRRCSRSQPNSGGCGSAPGCQLGVWATTNGGTTLVVHGRLARSFAGRRAATTTRRTGTTRGSPSTRTTRTASSSTRTTSGSRPAPARRSTTSPAATPAGRASTSTSTRSRSSPAPRAS